MKPRLNLCQASPEPTEAVAALAVVEWLTGDECHALDNAGFVAALGPRLRGSGMALDRLSLDLRILHPEIRCCTLAWAPGEPIEIHDREHGIERARGFAKNPVLRVMEAGQPLMIRLDERVAEWSLLEVFRGRGLVELIMLPLSYADGSISVSVFGTAQRTGFTDTERSLMKRILPALRTVCELRALRQSELTLLDTYVGAETGRRILAGRIRRNQIESLEAALLLCDLRGFTKLSNRLPEQRMLVLLNEYFDCVVPAITEAGGEILKFMGDAVLAYFHRDEPQAACVAAFGAARATIDALQALCVADAEIRAGIALHHGTVSYGNIGSGRRLDFTVIGPDVNLVSRIQSVCSSTGKPLLISERFAELLGSPDVTAIGRHELMGFADPIELYVPSQITPSSFGPSTSPIASVA
jgi:adenylate cyclase